MWGSWIRMGGLTSPVLMWALLASAGWAQPTLPNAGEALTVAVLPVPMRATSGDRSHVQVVVEVAGEGLKAGDDGDGAVEIVLHAFEADEASPAEAGTPEATAPVADAATETVAYGLDAANAGHGIKLVTGLSLAPGHYRLRALARDTVSGRTGMAHVAVSVSATPIILLPPLVPELADQWQVARPERPDLQAPPSPFFVEDQAFIPAARPSLAVDARRLPVVVLGYGLRDHEAEISSEVIDAEGQLVPGTQLVVSPAASARDGIDRIMGVLYLPDLPPGDYALRLGATDGAARASASASFVVDNTRVPSQLLRIVAPEVPPPAVEAYRPQESVVPLPAVPVRELVDGYRALLASLDPDDRAARIRALADFEIAAVGDEPEARLPRLKKSQMKVVQALAARDREALVPLMTLHHDVCLAHRRSRRAWLGRHGADMLMSVAAVYAPRSSSPGAHMVAAQALASLGGHLQAAGQAQGLELYREALTYQPNHAAALIGLAAHPEKRGGPYEHAVRPLRQLLEAHPDHREGQLRLALNLIRLDAAHQEDLAAGGRRRAKGLLTSLVSGDEADWIYVLAAQELARIHQDAKDWRAAIAVLTPARARMPHEQKVRIQLAHVLDRSGRPAEAQALLDDLRPDWSGMTPPRGRYNQWPNRSLDADRVALAAGASQRQALLVRAARHDASGGAL